MTTKELHELDAWIAEHVMGWKQVKFINCVEGTFAISEVYGVAKHKRRNELEPFNPTTDPASAMMVIEKMRFKIIWHHYKNKTFVRKLVLDCFIYSL